MRTFSAFLSSVLLFLIAAFPAYAQQADTPTSIPSCNYVKDARGYSYCSGGPNAAITLSPGGGMATYAFSYPGDSSTVFLTAKASPFDPTARSALGINVFDTESQGTPRLASTLTNNSLAGRPDTVQATYQSGVGGQVKVQLFNYWAKPVTFTFDQSGLMYGDSYVPNAMQLLSGAPPAGTASANPAAPSGPTAPATTGPCQFVLGFKTLHDLDPSDIGECVDAQSFAPNGDAQQHSTNGLMAWRKADNWTAFTNGNLTWINGPEGLVNRPNSERFPWEAAAPPPVGSRPNPFPLGATDILADGQRYIIVNSSVPDAGPQIAAVNMFNQPAAAGQQYFMALVTYGLGPGYTGAPLSLSDYDFRAVGSATNREYTTFSSSCGVVPNPLPDTKVFSAGRISGNICFAIDKADAGSLQIYPHRDETANHFHATR